MMTLEQRPLRPSRLCSELPFDVAVAVVVVVVVVVFDALGGVSCNLKSAFRRKGNISS